MALDHIFGRPSVTWKRIETLLLAYLSLKVLDHFQSTRHPWLKKLDHVLKKYRPWQIIVVTLMAKYLLSKTFLLCGLNAPEMYARHVRKLRSVATVEMMRVSWEKSTTPILWALMAFNRPHVKTVKEIWLSRQWVQPYAHRFPNWRPNTRVKLFYHGTEAELASTKKILLHIPGGGFVSMSPENHEEYIRLWARSLSTSACIVSVDYGKAPEYPFPYAIDECFDIYKHIMDTNGHCVGVNLNTPAEVEHLNVDNHANRVRIALAGDSAGGNFSAAVTMRIILYNQEVKHTHHHLFDEDGHLLDRTNSHLLLPKPEGLMIIYGALNIDMACWITPTHAPLLRPSSSSSLNGLMKHYKGVKYHTNRTSLDDILSPMESEEKLSTAEVTGLDAPYLALTSRMSYFSDRIITPELSRGMALLYIGAASTANPTTDMFLSPVVAPESILAEFPRIWMMCGECDPFVDDTVVFAARVRQAIARKREYQRQHDLRRDHRLREQNLSASLVMSSTSPPQDSSPPRFSIEPSESSDEGLSTEDQEVMGDDGILGVADKYGTINQDPSLYVTVKIYAGLSHAYLNMTQFLPEASHAVELCGQWLEEIFDAGEVARRHGRERHRLRKEAALKRSSKIHVQMEMRDEDNIPDFIQQPLGAEYRSVGGQQLEIRSTPTTVESEFTDKKKPSDIEVFDEPSKIHSPLRAAISETRKGIMSRLNTTSLRRFASANSLSASTKPEDEKEIVVTGKITKLPKDAVVPQPSLRMTSPAMMDPTVQRPTGLSRQNESSSNDGMFLSESEVVDRRRIANLLNSHPIQGDTTVGHGAESSILPSMDPSSASADGMRSDRQPLAD